MDLACLRTRTEPERTALPTWARASHRSAGVVPCADVILVPERRWSSVFRSTRLLESDMAIRTAIVEDVTSYAEILRRYIEVSDAPIVCTGIYDTAEQALPRLIEDPPNVAIVDIRLQGMSGIELVARLKSACPSVLCLILTSHDDGITIFTALKAGASGYLLKRAPAEDIVSAIVQTFEGGSPMSPQIARRVVD